MDLFLYFEYLYIYCLQRKKNPSYRNLLVFHVLYSSLCLSKLNVDY